MRRSASVIVGLIGLLFVILGLTAVHGSSSDRLQGVGVGLFVVGFGSAFLWRQP